MSDQDWPSPRARAIAGTVGILAVAGTLVLALFGAVSLVRLVFG